MTKNLTSRLITLLLSVLIAVTVLSFAGCSSKNDDNSSSKTNDSSSTVESSEKKDDSVLGEGSKSFTFEVKDGEGKSTTYTVKTDEKVVGKALLNLKLIEGEDGAYGLYVKKVKGIQVDFDKDGAYWAFYVNGEYAMTGVDQTNIEEGAKYTFAVEKE